MSPRQCRLFTYRVRGCPKFSPQLCCCNSQSIGTPRNEREPMLIQNEPKLNSEMGYSASRLVYQVRGCRKFIRASVVASADGDVTADNQPNRSGIDAPHVKSTAPIIFPTGSPGVVSCHRPNAYKTYCSNTMVGLGKARQAQFAVNSLPKVLS